MNKKLKEVLTFEVEIPHGFSLNSAARDRFSHWDNRLCDEKYPTRPDLIGKTFVAHIMMAQDRISFEDLLNFAHDLNYILPGVAGSALIPGKYHDQVKGLEFDVPIVCPEVKEFLYKKEGAHRVPYFSKRTVGKFSLHVMKMKSDIYAGSYVIFMEAK
jgi:hypothetical protein